MAPKQQLGRLGFVASKLGIHHASSSETCALSWPTWCSFVNRTSGSALGPATIGGVPLPIAAAAVEAGLPSAAAAAVPPEHGTPELVFYDEWLAGIVEIC